MPVLILPFADGHKAEQSPQQELCHRPPLLWTCCLQMVAHWLNHLHRQLDWTKVLNPQLRRASVAWIQVPGSLPQQTGCPRPDCSPASCSLEPLLRHPHMPNPHRWGPSLGTGMILTEKLTEAGLHPLSLSTGPDRQQHMVQATPATPPCSHDQRSLARAMLCKQGRCQC